MLVLNAVVVSASVRIWIQDRSICAHETLREPLAGSLLKTTLSFQPSMTTKWLNFQNATNGVGSPSNWDNSALKPTASSP